MLENKVNYDMYLLVDNCMHIEYLWMCVYIYPCIVLIFDLYVRMFAKVTM